MAILLPYCANLKYSITGGQTEVAITGDTTALCAELATPKHAFGIIYTANRSESVMVLGCGTDGKLRLQRGFGQSNNSLPFPDNACFKITEIVDGAVCEEDKTGDECPDIWARLLVGKGLELDRSDPDNPKLSIKETGVAAMEMCGAEINACGQFTYVPQNWPASCMPTFQPCCDNNSGGGTGATDACDVSFSPDFGSTVFAGDTVCEALKDLETAIMQINGSGSVPISSITAGQCIALSGPSTSPTISVSNSGLAPGIYAGFTFNACGMVTGYSAPPVAGVSITGTAPIVVNNVPGTGYVVSILQATVDQCGCVTLADEADAAGDLNALNSDDVVTVGFLSMALTSQPSVTLIPGTGILISSSPTGETIAVDPSEVVTMTWFEAWATSKGLWP